MGMRSVLTVACLAVGTMVGASAAQAVTYDLSADYSDTANPNGTWSYKFNGANLPHVGAPSGANDLNVAISPDGYFSTGNDLNSFSPDLFKAQVNGSAATGYGDGDFLKDDIVIHSPNDATHPLTIVWTAPSAGTVDSLLTSVWYAHSPISRSNDVTLSSTLSAVTTQLDAWTISKTSHGNKSDAATFTGGSFAVNAGDLITLSFLHSAGESFGSLNGVAMTVAFTAAIAPTPIPGALPLFAAGLAGLGWVRHRKRKQAA